MALAGCGATSHPVVHAPHVHTQAGAPSAVPVGAPGPAVTCTTTVDSAPAIQTALVDAHPGDIVCLSAGHYGAVELSGIAPAGTITLAPVPGAVVHVAALSFVGPQATANLTVQGLYIDGGVAVRTGTPGGLVFQHNTVENVPRGYAFYFYADGSSPGHYTQTGVKMLANQIDHVGACLEVDGGSAMASQFTFNGNVCGPGIGAGTTTAAGASHYVQVGGISGLTVQHNAFLGPMDPGYVAASLHNNVLHVFGDARAVTVSDNLIWHAQSRGQTILLEQGKLSDVAIDNNLDVEDPACDKRGQCAAYAIDVANAHGLRVAGNTIVDSYWGVLVTTPTEPGFPSGAGYRITGNLVVGTHGNPGISYGHCQADCLLAHNVTDDPSARVSGATGGLANWSPRWSETTWAPGRSYTSPPAGYWRPAGLPFTAGYQGSIGP